MANKLENKGWSPYLAGALVGVLAIVSVYLTTVLMGKSTYFGCSTTFLREAGFLLGGMFPEHVAENAYYIKEKVVVDWQFMFVFGILFGALISSKMSGSFKLESVPPLWAERFGPSIGKRALAAFFGGIVMVMGARLADGCTAGHGLSGMMQMAVSSLVALIFFFGVGSLVAHLIYRRK